MVMKSRDHRSTSTGGTIGVVARSALRALQIIVSLVIAGLYGKVLQDSQKAHQPAGSPYVFAEVVAAFSIVTAAVYLLLLVAMGWSS